MANICYQVFRSFFQVGFRFQYQLILILSGFPLTSFHVTEAILKN